VSKTQLREFLYVDVERTRSLLAQLDRGIVDSVVQRVTSTPEADASARIMGFGGGGSYSREHAREESKSLQDLTYSVFEESAEEAGFITDLPEDASSVQAWTHGDVHGQLSEGQILRIKADIQVVDSEFFDARLRRVQDFVAALVSLTAPEVGKAGNRQQREKAISDATKRVFGGTDPAILSSIAGVVTSLLAGAIAIRVLPCGRDHEEMSFGGVLLSRREYIQEEREALFSRYGSLLRNWTVVMQVATIPEQPTSAASPDFGSVDLLTPNNEVRRATLEKMVVDIITWLETIGLSEGPRWPAITVTPLAIYRLFSPS
jgi:hypothetical protein